MENLLIILGTILALIYIYCIFILMKNGAEYEDQIASMALEIAVLKAHNEDNEEEISKLSAAYEEAQELIEATKEYTQEATNREVLMQNGINSILGYDAMTALKDGGNKE